METNRQEFRIDQLRIKMTQDRECDKSPSNSNLKSPKFFPNLHKRSTTENLLKSEVITRDVSHRMDSLPKGKSMAQLQENKLKEILGVKQKKRILPQDLKGLEKAVKSNLKKSSKKQILSELESMKLKISKQKEKLLKRVIDEGGYLYRTQTGLILPQLTGMYESLLKKVKNSQFDLPRSELDLGNPSGRKEVGIIIGWLENMICNFVTDPIDITLEEKVRRASMIYTVCFKEVVRQVSNHCIERGILLQKIWNAQIDIYCAKEDEKIKNIEEIQKKFEEVLRGYKEKYENRVRAMEKGMRESKGMILDREKEILALKVKMEEMKAQNDKDRHALIMSFSKPVKKVTATGSFEEATLHLANKQFKTGAPVVIFGYYDSDGGFHKTKGMQNVNGQRLIEDQIDKVFKVYDLKTDFTHTEDFYEYLISQGGCKEFASQIPEERKFEICHEGYYTYRVQQARLGVTDKMRNSVNPYLISLNVSPKARSASFMSTDFHAFHSNSSKAQKKSPRLSTDSKKRNKNHLVLSPEMEIIETKVATPKEFKKNQSFNQIAKDKLEKINSKEINGNRKSSNLSSITQGFRFSGESLGTLKEHPLLNESFDSDEYSSLNSSIVSEVNSEKSSDSSIEEVPIGKERKDSYLAEGSEKNNSENLKASTRENKTLQKSKPKKMKKLLEEEKEDDEEEGEMVQDRALGNTIAVSPRYTILKTPPLNSSSESDAPQRRKVPSGTELPNSRKGSYGEELKHSEKSLKSNKTKSKQSSKEPRSNKKLTNKEINRISSKDLKPVSNKEANKLGQKETKSTASKETKSSVKKESSKEIKSPTNKEIKSTTANKESSKETQILAYKETMKEAQMLTPKETRPLAHKETTKDTQMLTPKETLSLAYKETAKETQMLVSKENQTLPHKDMLKEPQMLTPKETQALAHKESQKERQKENPIQRQRKNPEKSLKLQKQTNSLETPKNKSYSLSGTPTQSLSITNSQLIDLSSNPYLQSDLFQKLKNLNSPSELQEILKPFLTPQPTQFFDKPTQTDFNPAMQLEIPSIDPFSNSPNPRSRRKSFTKNPKKFQTSQYSSLNISQNSRTPNSYKKKTAAMIEEFNLGLILKKIIITHPGQKLFQQLFTDLMTEPISQPKISLKSLMKLINAVHSSKLTMIKENSANYKYEVSMILYDYLMKKYGLKNVAEGHFWQVLKAVMFFKDKFLRVLNFAKFLGCEKSEMGVEEWNFFTLGMDFIENFSYGKSMVGEEGVNELFCAFGVALQVIHNLFENKVSESLIEELLGKVSKMKIEENQSVSKRSSAQKIVENVNVDELLKCCVELFVEIREKVREKYWPGYGNDDIVSEEEFLELGRSLKFSENEPLGKVFEKYAVIQKVDEEKVQRGLKIRSLCAVVFENSLLDIRECGKNN